MTCHVLKVHPQFWPDLKSGAKPFEVRRNDRRFRIGDTCRLRKFDPSFGMLAEEPINRTITYILTHEDFPIGVPRDYVVLGFGSMPTFDDGK